MINSKYRWELPELDEGLAAEMAERLGVSRLVAGVLVARGWTPSDETKAYLAADAEQLLDPFVMKDMAAAAERIRRAISNGERIRVYGDYDADGVTSTALMIRLLSELGANFDTYIPHRSKEGYGLNIGAIDLAADAGVSLIVTVDNGISAVEQIAYAADKGIEVVVTDHHEPPELLPNAVALVNPKQKDCPYPFKGLCGAGVVFKLAHALMGRPVLEYADLAAIGTIADLMPLLGENRVIATLGLAQLRKAPVPGIRALAQASGVKPEELSSGRIGFGLAPRLNAGGRLEHAGGAVRLLVAESLEEAESLAGDLDRLNSERQALVEATVLEADVMWQAICADGMRRNVIVLAQEGWNAGIAGLVASKLVERYYRPAVILACDPATGACKGSARSIDGFDLYAALAEHADLMDHFGGHQAAAGMTIPRDNVEALSERLHALAEAWLTEEDWQPKKRVDLHCSLDNITLQAVDQLSRLEPFGNGNPTPRVSIPGVILRECKPLGKEGKHLKLVVEQAGRSVEAVGFGMGADKERMWAGMTIDLLGEPSVNEWNGARRVQLLMHDWKSGQLRLNDRRADKDIWASIARLLDTRTEGCAIVCASQELQRDAVSRFGHTGLPICAYRSAQPGLYAAAEAAAAADTADAVQNGNALAGGWRELILLGLPAGEEEAAVLAEWLSARYGGECVHVFADPRPGGHAGTPAVFPERSDFAKVYGLLRARGSWLDSPDGLLRDVSGKTGWPLAVVRMMQEVFTELGFITVSGVSRKIVAQPPRKELEQSERYRRAQRQAEALGLRRMSADELRRWFDSCHTG